MAKKQKPAPPPIEEPPSASSDKEHSLSHAETEGGADEDSDASSEDTQSPTKTSFQPPKPASSDSDTESDSGSGSESDTPVPSNAKPKPLASKPMANTPSPVPKPQPKPALKRPSNAKSNGLTPDPKRAKKNGKALDDLNDKESEKEGDKKAEKEADKKAPGQRRLWSEEDEIAILKGMVEFIPETGLDPYRNADDFYDFLTKSFNADASSNQLKEKIRRLKKKFFDNAQRGKNGEDPNFTRPIDRESFELSKKIWGNPNRGVGKEVKAVESDKKVAKTPKKEGRSAKEERSTSAAPPSKVNPVKSEARSTDSKKDVKKDSDEETNTKDATSYIMGLIKGDKGVGLYGLNEDVFKQGLELIGESDRKEFEGKWKELQDAEIELSVKRVELLANHARLAVEAYKSSSH